ncbi:zf-TFIIB domain-containing protein [Yersinia ruckeri]|uniref:Uncharacterized protein conserved in bacteria n=1 Tax=Yersinia ruckeri TaxID=29486 RepID=A0A085U7C6_YERRU|nr:zf-TFIIB domain-containing protein [Yersinia ruckeri]AJI96290.1 transcription factor zinc-finger family protein [Yersinia ruckeri]AKA37173.1 hypothetical protein UGYR_01395 [Yersinia ruckeri]ARZ01104.1 hypothetical protein QMA0440_01767 [Yersinia ruckeri]AUQ43178.1 hypothetical protein NJ56_15420 [Yersinia ruckeri]EKN3344844.1 zf-TFIIB domain-containing protein [Yersinia ruckeri]
MHCPICKDTQLVMSERKGIEIDYCPSCRGVWLDRGELDKIIEKSTESAPVPSSSDRRHDSRGYSDKDHGDYDKHRYPKKRKSFLSELFD